jgi:hypothetical protein
MARRLIDISVPLQNDVPADPPGIRPTVQYNDHQRSLPQMLGFFEGLRVRLIMFPGLIMLWRACVRAA